MKKSGNKRLPKAKDSRIRKKYKIKHPRSINFSLKEKSPFYINKLRFFTPKPKISAGPKLYRSKVPNELLYEYKPNLFGVKHQMRLHTRVNLNIPIPLVTGVPKSVSNDDDDLLDMKEMEPRGGKTNTSKFLNENDLVILGEKVNKKEKQIYKTTYSWLRKTEYISSRKQNQNLNGMGGSGFRKTKHFRVEESFQDSSEKIVKHPTKKGVHLVESYDIIPDFVNWQNDYIQVHFDRDFDPVDQSLLVRSEEEKAENELQFYEKDSHENGKYNFKKKFTVDKFNENVHFIRLNEKEKTAMINPLNQYYIMKKNPYQSKSNPPLMIQTREKTDDENEYIKVKMSQLGMEYNAE